MDAVISLETLSIRDSLVCTDKNSEAAILDVVQKHFSDYFILGVEGGLAGDSSSDYLWCTDPLDGTTNFAHCYPSFTISVAVLFRGKPAAATMNAAWATNIELFKEFADVSRGVRRLVAAAVDMCHVALGIVEAYWEYCLKPWDMAAGILIVEEAGGTGSCMDGCKFSVFDRSVLVSNGVLHDKLLERSGPATKKLKSEGIDFALWYKPENYRTQL